MRQILSKISILFLLVASFYNLSGQHYVIRNFSDTITTEEDSILILVSDYRGEIEWQVSSNPQSWDSIMGAYADSVLVAFDSTVYYRAVIREGSCEAIYSDTLVVIKDLDEYLYHGFEMAYPDSIGESVTVYLDSTLVTCKLINNEYVFQGDIILDVAIDSSAGSKGASIFSNTRLWSKNTIYYSMSSNFKLKNEVDLAIAWWELVAPQLVFEVRDKEPNFIDFVLTLNNSSSNLGMIGGRQSIRLNSNADEGTVAHEIGHALGLIHEHSRMDRDMYITVHYENIWPRFHDQFDIPKSGRATAEFDFESIMLYANFLPKATKDDSKPAISRKGEESTYNARRGIPSNGDVEMIEILYPKNISVTGSFIDSRDGNEYNWVKIGDQIWMAENLKYLPEVMDVYYGSDTLPQYYVYDNETSDLEAALSSWKYNTYGVLYNWPAASQSCPVGWHLPSDYEWMELESFIGIVSEELDSIGYRGTYEGNDLKSEIYWSGTDNFGFTGLPAGRRTGSYNHGYDIGLGKGGIWWSSTFVEGDDNFIVDRAWRRSLTDSSPKIYRSLEIVFEGYSVRCIKD